MREQAHEPQERGLDHVDAGRLQGFKETAGQAHGHAIAIPDLAPLARHERNRARLGGRLAIEMREQDRGGLVLIHVVAGVDVAVAGAVLQRNAP